MVNIKINGKSIGRIPTSIKEFTIAQFEKLIVLMNKAEITEEERYYELFLYLGISEDDLDMMDIGEFRTLIGKYRDLTDLGESKLKKSFKFQGKKYEAFTGKEFRLTVRHSKLIEKYMISDPFHYLAEFCAIIFVEEGVSISEAKTDAYIKEKANAFREALKVEVVLPYLNIWTTDVLNLVNGTTDTK
jgi:hypothetical protein